MNVGLPLLLCAVVVSLAGCSVASTDNPVEGDRLYTTLDTTIQFQDTASGNNSTFSVYVADEPHEQSAGLGPIEQLRAGEGMLFLYDTTEVYTYWMKDVEYAIDIVWLLDDVIVDITTDVLPEDPETPYKEYARYAPSSPVNQVLEIPAGTSRTKELAIGMRYSIVD